MFTGASGGIGTMIRPLLAPLYPGLVLSDRVAPKDLLPGETFVTADLTKPDEVAAAVKGADSVIHLGGHSVEGAVGRRSCTPTSSAATTSSRRRGRPASSAWSSPRPTTPSASIRAQRKIGTDVTVRPDSRYGVSKAFGEALGALYSDKHGMSRDLPAHRQCRAAPLDVRRLSIWISPEDIVQLIRIGLEHPDIRFEILYGASGQ